MSGGLNLCSTRLQPQTPRLKTASVITITASLDGVFIRTLEYALKTAVGVNLPSSTEGLQVFRVYAGLLMTITMVDTIIVILISESYHV